MAWQNKGRTLKWLAISIGITLVLTVGLWQLTGSLFFFGFLFLPFLFGGGRLFGGQRHQASPPSVSRCTSCGYETLQPEGAFCPRCGERLPP